MLLLAGGIALAAVIVFALWNVIMGSFRKEPVQTEFTVPNLLGMTIEEAEADERVKGIFTITEMGSRASSEYAEGQIVEQTPAADNVVRSNREIQVFVSTAKRPSRCRASRDWSGAARRSYLTTLGWTCSITGRISIPTPLPPAASSARSRQRERCSVREMFCCSTAARDPSRSRSR